MKFLQDMLAPSGKWSFPRVMTAIWFVVLCWFAISNGKAFGSALSAMFNEKAAIGATSVPYLAEFSYFLIAVFAMLLGIVFANKTSLNAFAGFAKRNGEAQK